MAAIKHTLKRDIFLPAYERLIEMVHVTKSGKKKKSSFLCVIVTTEKPMKVIVYQLKKFGETYKKKESWLLKHLKLVDGKDAAKDTAEFELHFDKVYKWIASSIQEKNSFISCLWKLSLRYIPRQKPQFNNIPEDLMEDPTLKSAGETVREVVEDSIIEVPVEDYQEITPREEADLEKLMSQCDYAISNAEAFMDQLSRELSVLDGANIHTIMASEQQVVNLMTLLEDAIVEASKIEDKLDVYDKLLQNVRDHMELMEEKDTMIQVQNRNTTRLLEDLDHLIGKLDLPHQYQMALLGGDLTIASNVLECTVAAQALQEVMNAKLQPGLVKLAAVSEQQKLFEKLRTKFAQQLSRHLNNLFIHLGNEIGEPLSQDTMDLSLPKHHACHRELVPYTDLMLWLKTADNNSFKQLAKIYTASLSKLYERELKDFFESAKPRINAVGKGQEKKGKGNNSGSTSSTGSQELQSKALSGRLRSQSLIGMDRTDYGSDLDLTERHKFDKVLENILCELEPVCLAEQSFCLMFFHAGSESLNTQESENSFTGDKSSEDVSAASDASQKKQSDKQINEEVRKMMGELFAVLEPELQNFITFADKVDTFYSMYMLVRLSQHVMLAQDAGGSFLSIIFANGLVQAKRNFDKYMKSQIQSIEEAKVSKKSRVGIIPFVSNFEDFAQQAEIIFRGSDRRTDLDKWYVKVMNFMIEAIPRVATEQQKNPVEVVMLENYHNLYSSLSQLKITCLENERREARQRYSEHLQAYVTAYLGRPLEKLNNFFEGIQSKVAQGVKEEEVGYQLAFSKQELRKVIKEYPGKEVKKGLESLYKKIDKHLCEEENLLQVVWHSMQEEFIRQYKNFESLIERCYPGSMITLEFTINDILAYFSDIARSH